MITRNNAKSYYINKQQVYIPNSSIKDISLNPACGLKHLELSYNSLSTLGACRLADYLYKNTTLEMLGLWGNDIQDEGKERL